MTTKSEGKNKRTLLYHLAADSDHLLPKATYCNGPYIAMSEHGPGTTELNNKVY